MKTLENYNLYRIYLINSISHHLHNIDRSDDYGDSIEISGLNNMLDVLYSPSVYGYDTVDIDEYEELINKTTRIWLNNKSINIFLSFDEWLSERRDFNIQKLLNEQ